MPILYYLWTSSVQITSLRLCFGAKMLLDVPVSPDACCPSQLISPDACNLNKMVSPDTHNPSLLVSPDAHSLSLPVLPDAQITSLRVSRSAEMWQYAPVCRIKEEGGDDASPLVYADACNPSQLVSLVI